MEHHLCLQGALRAWMENSTQQATMLHFLGITSVYFCCLNFFFFLLILVILFHLLSGEKYWYVTARLTEDFTSFLNKTASVTGREEVHKPITSALKIKLVIYQGYLLREGFV